ncbi:hypothetical protein CKO44_02130 [Rubrivivax gelatinosus]|uniref:Methyltransferase FkbM domain-containing protein n=1 Tax=Rubrivivax gelatinosus TaxID=28068 RepID=A0ABS1DWH1_RUBGE|nr:FkbM family methyltransferase [Rubrivivax gelatinosus]MBK1612262.1 hypothetical protein [Rubrivivax gelatinosus]MBK1714399.1 hypothetical protein [Rubrivivax gelatinosus]
MNVLPWRLRVRLEGLRDKRSWALSQAGQDQWVFGEAYNEATGRYFLDIGAHDGVSISNTYVLERRYQWKGLCIEANPKTFQALVRNRRAACVNVCLDRTEGEVDFAVRDVLGGIVSPELDNAGPQAEVLRVRTRPLLDVLREHAAPAVIDYLSIDVEGAEERILDSFDFDRYRFNCMTIERPSAVLRALFARHGYVIVKEIPGLDCFYLHSDFLPEYKRNLFAFYDKKHLSLRWG